MRTVSFVFIRNGKMLKISILTIGDEICIGQITNTNSVWIAQQCVRLGCMPLMHSTIGDNKEHIVSELDRLNAFSDIIIITGGLGPTHDDITKPTLCEYYGDELVLNQDVLEELKRRYAQRGIDLSERNAMQAWLPSRCKVLHNPIGTAPGMLFEQGGKIVVSLPGVPREMMKLIELYVLPLIAEETVKRNEDVVVYKNLQTSGITESNLADRIGKPEDFLGDATLAFLPSYQGVRLRIGANGTDMQHATDKINQIENIIRERAGKYIFGTDDDNLSSAVGRLLKSRGETVAVAESCTGGLLGGAITAIAGSSAYFAGGMITYSNDAKISHLGVNSETISKYGAVSGETAEEMAEQVRLKFGTDFGISITGIAGPDGGSYDKPVGTVWIGLSSKDAKRSTVYLFGEDRVINRERSVGTALKLLMDAIGIKENG